MRSPAVASKSGGGKTIAIDCRFASTLSGLGRYTRELTCELVKRSPSVRYVLIVASKDEDWIPDLPQSQIIETSIRHYSIAEQLSFPSIIRASGSDLLFSPHFNVPFSCPIPFVVTIHDLILHRFPNDASFIKRIAYRSLMKHAVEKSQAIIAISNFVSSEIQQEYGAAASPKITVVTEGVSSLYHPVDDLHADASRKKYDLMRPFFLYIGNAKEHKNVRFLIDAFSKAGDTGHDLILLSGGKEADALLPLPAHVRIIEGIADADLPALYTLAEASITASLYEGFCLPVAEALACGCPVIATNRSAIPETADGHALLLEPETDAYITAFQKTYVHQSPFLVGTWEKTAMGTEAILLKAIS